MDCVRPDQDYTGDRLTVQTTLGMTGRRFRILAFVMIGLGVSMIGLAAASSVLFTQTFPAVPSAPVGSIVASCSSLQSWGGPVPSGGGSVLFNCTGHTGAFVVSNPPVDATPSFTLPTNATDLYVLPALPVGPGGACSTYQGAIALTSGSSATLATSGNWDYCVDATGSLTGFSISWSS